MNLEQFLDYYGIKYTVKGNRVIADWVLLSERQIKEIPDDIGRLICRSLDLSYNDIKVLPDSIGDLICWELDLGFNLITHIPETICNIKCVHINLNNNEITHLPESICRVICYSLDCSSNRISSLNESIYDTKCVGLSLRNYKVGRLRTDHKAFDEIEITDKYIFCDGILIWYKSKKNVGNYTIYKGYYGDYVAQSGNVFAHGDSIEECISDVIYKKSDRDSSKYKNLDQDKKIPLDEMILIYRTITGACSGGVKRFLDEVEVPDELSINKVKDLTLGLFGNEKFCRFFNKNSDVKNEERQDGVMNFLKFKGLTIGLILIFTSHALSSIIKPVKILVEKINAKVKRLEKGE